MYGAYPAYGTVPAQGYSQPATAEPALTAPSRSPSPRASTCVHARQDGEPILTVTGELVVKDDGTMYLVRVEGESPAGGDHGQADATPGCP